MTPLLVRAARGEQVERPPVWAMRQAGRWDPEFNRVRAGLPFYEFSENVELAARASLLPRRFGVDGIILFYDITTLPVAMGQPFTLQPAVGPVPEFTVRCRADLDRLAVNPDPARYQHIRDLLRLVKEELRGELPVLVFADRAREIRNAVELCDKQKLKMILAGGEEAYKVKDLLRSKSIPVILRPILTEPLDEDDAE